MIKIKYPKLFFLTFFLLFIIKYTFGFSPKRETRACWITTVANLDWPSTPTLTSEEQKKELITILDQLDRLNFNTIFFQVRPACDAFYQSELEPWSRYLCKNLDNGPYPFYDPLKFAIEECQKRNIDLHAWINPFRAQQKTTDSLHQSHVINQHPEWIIEYGSKAFLDPGIPDARKYVKQVICDITSRYNIKGIHFDDYFYPYPIANKAYPDSSSFRKYGNNFQPNEIDDWRRQNVDQFIINIKESIDSIKPEILFGVSPFGVWRNFSDDPQGSMTTAGVTTYDHLYADALKWINKGWVDYLAPQIYWEIGHPAADYITLANWWNSINTNRHIYIGHAMYKAEDPNQKMDWKMAEQLPEQIEIARSLPKIQGDAFFRTEHVLMNPIGFCDTLQKRLYKYEALPEIPKWKNHPYPNPVHKFKRAFLFCKGLKWKPEKKNRSILYYSIENPDIDFGNAESIFSINREKQIKFKKRKEWKGKTVYFSITSLDEYNYESTPSKILRIKF